MTTERYQRCSQCGRRYTFIGSGHGSLSATNHERRCGDCQTVVLEALMKIEQRYEMRRQETSETERYKDVNLALILEWEARHAEKAAKEPKRMYVRRVVTPLFNLNTGDVTNGREVPGMDKYQGTTFMVMTWEATGVLESLTVEMEYDLVSNRFTGDTWK